MEPHPVLQSDWVPLLTCWTPWGQAHHILRTQKSPFCGGLVYCWENKSSSWNPILSPEALRTHVLSGDLLFSWLMSPGVQSVSGAQILRAKECVLWWRNFQVHYFTFTRSIVFIFPSIDFINELFYLTCSIFVLLRVSELEEGDSMMVLSLFGSLCHRI